jgi:hypothetical protein
MVSLFNSLKPFNQHNGFQKPFNSKKKIDFYFLEKKFPIFLKKSFRFFFGKKFSEKSSQFFWKKYLIFFRENFSIFFRKKVSDFSGKKVSNLFSGKNSFYVNCKKLAIIIVHVLVCNFKSK